MPHQDYGESLHNVHLRGLKKSRLITVQFVNEIGIGIESITLFQTERG